MVMYSTISTNLKFILKSRLVKLERFISIIKRQSITKNMYVFLDYRFLYELSPFATGKLIHCLSRAMERIMNLFIIFS
jgi:hypothetical protein